MDDRKLLELAAKSAGIEVWFPRMNGGKNEDGSRIILEPCHTWGPDKTVIVWNPLTDDGDALRLLVKLGIEIRIIRCHPAHGNPRAEVRMKGATIVIGQSCANNDAAYASATRRAIVRAAAAIGEGMV